MQSKEGWESWHLSLINLTIGWKINMDRNTVRQTDRHPFNSLFFRTTWVSRHRTRKVKPIWILMKQEITGWQWHQLYHMQIISTLLQTDNHASTSSLIFFTGQMLFLTLNQDCQITECYLN